MSRPSPSESATIFKINTVKIGYDGYKYIVVSNKNGIKRWSKIKTFDAKSYLNKSFKELEKHGIASISTPITNNIYSDEVYKYVEDKIISSKKYVNMANKFWNIKELNDKTIDQFPHIYYRIRRQEPTELYISHNIPNSNQKTIIYNILKKHFGNKFSWNKSNRKAIVIKTGVKPTPVTRNKNDYGAEWGIKTQKKLHAWLKEYPEARFKKVGKQQARWHSPNIDKYLKEYKIIRKELVKRKLDLFDDYIYPLTPWISPKDAEQEVKEWLLSAKSSLK